MNSLVDKIRKEGFLVSDGAWGTMLQTRGLQPEECPELWNVERRSDIVTVAGQYVRAGVDMILTNSFGAHPLKLAHYGLAARTAELNEAAAALSREAAGYAIVLGSMGPCGVLLMTEAVSEQEVYDGFAVQAAALKRGGVDALCIETMSGIDEASLAVRAAKEAAGLEIVCTFTFDRTVTGEYRTMMGVSPADSVRAMRETGVSIVGSNCGNGFVQMREIVAEMRQSDASVPILVHANAGRPQYRDGTTVYPETPEIVKSIVPSLVAAGANIIGGCCGTTPDHIRAIVEYRESVR